MVSMMKTRRFVPWADCRIRSQISVISLRAVQVNNFQKVSFVYHFIKEFKERKFYLTVHLQWKIKLCAVKFAWSVKAKHCLALSTNFWKQKCFALLIQVNFTANNLKVSTKQMTYLNTKTVISKIKVFWMKWKQISNRCVGAGAGMEVLRRIPWCCSRIFRKSIRFSRSIRSWFSLSTCNW